MQEQKQPAEPIPTPTPSAKQEEFLPMMENLSLIDKGLSCKETEKDFMRGKTKQIGKSDNLKRKYKKGTTRNKENSQKKIIRLQNKVQELQRKIDTFNRQMETCSNCRNHFFDASGNQFQRFHRRQEKQVNTNPFELQQHQNSKDSHGSIEFQNINFNSPYMYTQEMDQRSWIYLGTLMIAMGSCSMDFDGTINVFKVLKQSVDSLRRQVEKSVENISMDFFMSKESLQQNNLNLSVDDIGFDPFINKLENPQALALEAVKVESVEQFQLLYDNKVTFNLKYDSLIKAMEHIRENCWVSMQG